MQQSMKRLIGSMQLRELKNDYIAVKLFALNESCARSHTNTLTISATRSCCFIHQQHFVCTVIVCYMLFILKLNYILIALQDTKAAHKHITQQQKCKKQTKKESI